MKHALPITFLLVLLANPQFVAAQESGVDQVIITEIMYNPPEAGQDSLEFLELYNPSQIAPVNMENYYFSDGIEYVFPAGVSIAPEGFLILAKDSVAFESVFGMEAREWTSMSLLNNGEGVTIRNSAGFVVDTVEYNDVGAWPSEANGLGASLALCDPSTDNNDVANWGVSSNNTGIVLNAITIYADPGALSTCMTVGIEDDESDNTFSVYPNPSNGHVSIRLSNSPSDNTMLNVYSSIGQMIHTESVSQTVSTIDLSGYSGVRPFGN